MYHPLLFAQDFDAVKSQIIDSFCEGLDQIFDAADSGISGRECEEQIWALILSTARLIMTCLLSLQCRRATENQIEEKQLDRNQIRLRNEPDYWMTMTTTFGPVPFFSFAYRDSSSGVATVTRTPARDRVFPLHRHCRSSELCLEWETRLGSEMPFRHAQKALTYFTHGAVELEDTTIAAHLLIVAKLVERHWLYQKPETIRETLRQRATRDAKTGKPIIYLSTDAHALRRYVDDTWSAAWKMANGLRLWCVDRHNGAIIHLGGEFTWGDCHQVARIVEWLGEQGHLPVDGDYGDGVEASIAIVTDGAPWIEDHVVAKFTCPVVILDAYHALERIQEYATARFGKGSVRSRLHYDRWVSLLLGERPKKGHKLRKKKKEKAKHANIDGDESAQSQEPSWQELYEMERGIDVLIEKLRSEKILYQHRDARDKLLEYLTHNAYRMEYRRLRARGYQIGSGAMESLHRTGSQKRLKIPGARWLPETSQALFALRMLHLCGRWDEFWHQPRLEEKLVEAFSNKSTPEELDDHEAQDEAFQEAA